ncbi:hypothetical protein ElyMa_004514600, partial [Elysia marginata]
MGDEEIFQFDHRQPNQWAALPRPITGPVAPPASHAYSHSHASRTPSLEPGSPRLRSRAVAASPPPLPLELPLPTLRHVPSRDTTPLQSNIYYKPYPDQPPSPTPQGTLSPRLKHKLVLSPPSRRKQQPPQRQISQQIQYKLPDSQSFLHHQQQHDFNEQLRHQQETHHLQQKEERFHSQQKNQTPVVLSSKALETHQQVHKEPARHKEKSQEVYSLPLEKYLQQHARQHEEHQYRIEQYQEKHQPSINQLRSQEQQGSASPFHTEQQNHKLFGVNQQSTEPFYPEMPRAMTLPRPQNLPRTPNPPENFPYQLMTPPGQSQPMPVKDFIEQLQEDLVSPKESKSIKEQYEEFERKRKEEEQSATSSVKRNIPSRNEFFGPQRPTQPSCYPPEMGRRPSYPPPQEPRTHHRRPPPPAPLNLRSPPTPRSTGDPFSPTSNPLSPPSYISKAGFFSPQSTPQYGPGSNLHRSRAMFFSPPPSSSSTRMFSPPPVDHNRPRVPPSKVYRPTAMSEMLLRGSPTPSLPSDVLRHRQDASPTPSQSSTLSEQVLGGVSTGRGKRSRGLNLFLKQQNRMAALDAKAQDEDAGEERNGPQANRPPFQHAGTFDDADLQRNGRVGGRASQDNFGRGYYTVGRPSNLAFLSRSKSLQSSPTAPSYDGRPYPRGRESGPGGPTWAQEIPGSSPRRIPITVRHEPPSHTLPRLSRFNSEGSQPIHNQTNRSQYNQNPLPQHQQEQYQQQQQQQHQHQQHQYQKPYQQKVQQSHQEEHSPYQNRNEIPENLKPSHQWLPSSNRNIPILHRRTRRLSEEDSPSSSHIPPPEEAPSKLSSSWQSSDTPQRSSQRPGVYATLPSKSSQQRARQQQQQQQGHIHQQEQQQFFDNRSGSFTKPSEPIPVPFETYATLPTIKPLKSSSTISSFSDPRKIDDSKSGYNYSSSFPGRQHQPVFKTSQSSFEFGDLRDLQHTLDDTNSRKDYSKPLWTNTDLDRRSSHRSSVSSISLGDDGHSPYSDNAVSSSDSRDTIIAKEEKAASELFSQKRNVNKSFLPMHPFGQEVDFVQEQYSKPWDYQQSQQDRRPMEYPNSYPGTQHSSFVGDPRPQHRLGPPTSPKPGRRIPVTVVHEQSASSRPHHVIGDLKGSDGHDTNPEEQTPYHFSHQERSDFRQNGPAANEFHGISYAPSKPADNWGTQTLPARAKVEGRESKPSPTEGSLRNIAPVWKPSGSGVSSLIKKEYKPVRLDTSKKPVKKEERTYQPEQEDAQSWRPQPRGAPAQVEAAPVEPPSFPTLPPPSLNTSTDSVFSSSSSQVPFLPPPPPPAALSASSTSSSLWATATDYTDPQSDSTLVSSVVQPPHHMNGGAGDREDTHRGAAEDSRLPPTQSPYITLLQKSRDPEDNEDFLNTKFVHKPIMVKDDGQLPKGATYIGSKHKVEDNRSVTEDYYTTPVSAPSSETSSSRVVEHKPVKYEGIGPLDKEGVPLANRK